ncbi:uncharacterized protein Nmag_0373 [Natrialba magadii ATCC 43099]|uniref:Uncharacterized protein n=1 Tax=Natrialba magadii (strain ATCC 43099 / DSM 3394 / CCM 3739 / CIP 104546 / IAM 13178 / JCM 8861 / NBRC 102185 / NCIMB 2190 / MS3) TaxID=547559 RepID=D3SXS3_NATMM|nr:uncharacterized protein Nmag_0373 [Natrialba magadii ATCC 43099]
MGQATLTANAARNAGCAGTRRATPCTGQAVDLHATTKTLGPALSVHTERAPVGGMGQMNWDNRIT